MDLGISGKKAIVCAASAGIGRGIAESLVREGCHVAIIARESERLYSTAEYLRSLTDKIVTEIACDLSIRGQIVAAYETAVRVFDGPIDILVNNQGGPIPGELMDVREQKFEEAFHNNVLPVVTLTSKVLPAMQENRWGRILNVLSISGKEPLPGMVLSNSLRPAVLGIAKSLAKQYAADGITINSLLPANVLTDRTRGLLERRAQELGISLEEALDEGASSVPMNKMASPEEFASVATFLCSERASFVTGVAIPVDGGMSSSLF